MDEMENKNVDDIEVSGNGEVVIAPKVYKTEPKIVKWWNKVGIAWAFILPFIVFFLLFSVIPLVSSIYYCFTYYNMVEDPVFNGLENFRYMLMDDEISGIAFKNTLTLALLTGPTGYILSFFFAWMVNNLKHKSFFVVAFYTPTMVSGTAISVIWMTLFGSSRYGYLNYALLKLGLISQPIAFTMQKGWIVAIVVIITLWMSLGTNFLIFFAGLQNCRKELYEAAYLDGMHNIWQELWYITLPLMKPQLLYTMITSITAAFSVGDICTTVAGNPSPDYCVHTLVLHIADMSGTRYEMGYACAMSLVVFAMTFTLGRLSMKLLSSKDEL